MMIPLPDENTQDQISEFQLDGLLSACGAIALAFDIPEEWSVVIHFPKTINAVRRIPTELHGKFVTKFIQEFREATQTLDADGNVTESNDFMNPAVDSILSMALHDMGDMVMSISQAHAQRQAQIRQQLAHGAGGLQGVR